jgi:pilus assembly protein CpaF
MLSITISEKGGASKRRDFQKDEITIGRVQGNDIILPRGNVSKKHARIVQRDGKMVVLDLKSTNGTYVNGKRITAPQVVRDSDRIQVGDFVIQLAGAPAKKKEKPSKKGRKATDRGVKKRLDVKEEPELLDDFEDFDGEVSSTSVDVEEMEADTPKPKAKPKAGGGGETLGARGAQAEKEEESRSPAG